MGEMIPLASLDDIPVELMELVVAGLELQDICSLRLVSRRVSAKSSNGVFKQHFRNKIIYTNSDEHIHIFVFATQPNYLGCLVEHLTLISVPEPACLRKRLSTELLSRAMRNLRLNSPRGCLQTLSLKVEKEEEGLYCSWQNVWDAAACLFYDTALALGASGLAIQTFNIFSQVDRCSLACDQIAPVFEDVDLSTSLRGLKHLSLSLSHQLPTEHSPYRRYESRPRQTQPVAIGSRVTHAICRFLDWCPQLEELELHWYNLRCHNLSQALVLEQHFFDRVANECNFPCLKKCSLMGIETSSASLLKFLHKVQLVNLSLEEFHLHLGKFRPIFDYLVNDMATLDLLHLDDLYEERYISFDDPGMPHFPTRQSRPGPNVITRIGTDVRKPIGYGIMGGSSVGCWEAWQWGEKRKRLYGPPSGVFL